MKALMELIDGLGKLALAAIGCVMICICGACVLAVVLVAGGEKAATKQAVNDNQGYGTEAKPIPAGEYAKFKEGWVRIAEADYNATQRVLNETLLGETNLAGGARFVLIRFELYCVKQHCDQSELDLRLVAEDGKRWSEELSVPQYNLEFPDAVQRGGSTGWQVFEFPVTGTVQTVQVKWGSVTLYLAAP